MTALFIDISSFRIAPTVGREVASMLVSLAVILVAVLLFLDAPLLQVLVPTAFAVYAVVRVVVAALRARDHAHAPAGQR